MTGCICYGYSSEAHAMDWNAIITLVDILAWPLVVAGALITFRKPLAMFLSSIGGRVIGFSVFDISIELAELPAPPSPWADPRFPESSQMTGGEVMQTGLKTLFERISVETPWDYLVVDIKDGRFWLSSRLFVFTVFLQALRGVRCVAFVESKGEQRRRLVGLAAPEDVRAALGRTYPWFESALFNAMHQHQVYRLDRSLDADLAGQVVRNFIEDPQMRMIVPPATPDEWTQLGTQPIWEHTGWLTLETANTHLREWFFEWDATHYADFAEASVETRFKTLLRRKAPFVALVNSRDEFKALLDR
jgi:hypothetical protein